MNWGVFAAGMLTGIIITGLCEWAYDEFDYRRTMKELDEEKEK